MSLLGSGCQDDRASTPVAPRSQRPLPSPGSFLLIECQPDDPQLRCRCTSREFRADPDPVDLTAAAEWRSSNPDAIVVDGGLVTALQPGRATITAVYSAQSGARSAEQLVVANPGRPPRPAWPFYGTVRRAGQVPFVLISEARIDVRAPFGETYRLASDAEGRFTFDGLAGDYEVSDARSGYQRRTERFFIPLFLPPGTSSRVFELVPN
jgi:hypothetical protein